jgi:hypothetical protein
MAPNDALSPDAMRQLVPCRTEPTMDASRSSRRLQRAFIPSWRQRLLPWVVTGLLLIGVLLGAVTGLSSAPVTSPRSAVNLESLLVTRQDLGPGWSTEEPIEVRTYANVFAGGTRCRLPTITGTGAEANFDSVGTGAVFQEAVIWTPNASQTFSVIKKRTSSGCFRLSAYAGSLGGQLQRETATRVAAQTLGSLPQIATAWRLEGKPITYEEDYYVLADNYVIRVSYSGVRPNTKVIRTALRIL